MKMLSVYQLINRTTGLSYVGVTSQRVEKRVGQHLRPSKDDHRRLANAVRNFNREVWDHVTLYRTPVPSEAEHMERAFIKALDTIENGYNSQCGEVFQEALDVACAYMKYGSLEGLSGLYYKQSHPDYPDVVVFQVAKSIWKFGFYAGDVWQENDRVFDNMVDVNQFVRVNAGELGLAPTEPLDECFDDEYNREFDADALTPLKALSEIQNIIQNTEFSTQDDIEHFFTVLGGLKSTV